MRVGRGEQHEPPLFLDGMPKCAWMSVSHVLAEACRLDEMPDEVWLLCFRTRPAQASPVT